jgi:hypothetical protein
MTHVGHRDTQKSIHLCQAVLLTGLGTEKFEQTVDAFIQIHTMFSCIFKDGVLDPWLLSAFEDHNAIDISNRYFTSCCQNLNAIQLSFHELVDLDRILANMAVGDLVNSKENDVQFFKLVSKDGDTQERYTLTRDDLDMHS